MNARHGLSRAFRPMLAGAAAAVCFAAFAPPIGAAEWKPGKPITIIVTWAAGGSTDQVTRILAGDLEEALGQKVVVVNQPGASGSIGIKSVIDAPRDGYTWAAGAAGDLGTYRLLGMLDTDITDWHLYFDVANVAVVSVNAATPYKNFDDLIKAFKSRPGKIAVATAGQSSSGHLAIEVLRRALQFDYKHVTYDGGNPAVIATVGGETEVVTQLAVEQVDMLRAGRLRALAVLSDEPLKIDGLGDVPPVTRWIPGFNLPGNYFGVWLPRGVPDDVVLTLNRVWKDRIAKSRKLPQYAASRGAQFAPHYGLEALRRVIPYIQNAAAVYHEAGKTKLDPVDLGILKP